MLLSLSVAVILAAPQPIKVATLGLQAADVPAARAEVLSDYFAQRLSEAGHGHLSVITPSQIATLLGFERQRMLLGCNDEGTSCMAELSNALGADAVLAGTLGRIGNAWAINLKLVGARDGRELSARSGHVEEEAALLGWLATAAREMAPELVRALRPDELPAFALAQEVEETGGGGSLRSRAWIPAAAGVVLVGGGGVFLALAADDAKKLEHPRPEYSAEALAASGRTRQVAGDALVAGGLAALATAGLMYALGGPDAPQETTGAALIPGPHGGALVVTGRFP